MQYLFLFFFIDKHIYKKKKESIGMAASIKSSKRQRRLHPGSRLEDAFQWPFETIDSLESSFNVQEYLQQLIRKDCSNVQLLVELPENVEKDIWQYEHLRQVCLELSLLVVALESNVQNKYALK
ncbi:unnamed protein product [Rhizopus stolonifer]